MPKICDDLRQAVLQEAIQGKLTEQLKSDGNARDLLKQIAEEKAQLIKEKKIKKEKSLPEITEDKVPFDIPENWAWVYLQDLLSIISDGTHKTPQYTNSGVPFLSVQNISGGVFDFSKIKYISEDEHKELVKRVKPEKNDILFCRIGTLGKAIKNILDFDFSIFVSLGLLRCVNYSIADFLVFIINSPLGYNWIQENKVGGGTHTFKINLSSLPTFLVPLPPLAEQQRIVAKVEQLMAEIDELEKIENELITLKEAFPGDMKAALLQEAMQGKLTEQLKSDGNARDLLKEIKAEKEALIKTGKLKKEKPLAEISEDEVPFDIPENWEWVRLGSVSTYSETKSKVNALSADESMWLLDLEDIEKGGCLLQKKTVKNSGAKGDKTVFNNNDILYSKLRPYLKKVLIADADGICTPELIPFRMYGNIEHSYVVKYLVSPFVDKFINDITYGVKMPRVGTDTMVNLLFPLPPLAEQKRIVAKLDKLLPLVEGLKEE